MRVSPKGQIQVLGHVSPRQSRGGDNSPESHQRREKGWQEVQMVSESIPLLQIWDCSWSMSLQHLDGLTPLLGSDLRRMSLVHAWQESLQGLAASAPSVPFPPHYPAKG